ncbi:hypothetical protein J2857_001177 [Neorhizobium galegae]|nr:hypothetical protein [Neorhizobium galegae]
MHRTKYLSDAPFQNSHIAQAALHNSGFYVFQAKSNEVGLAIRREILSCL